MQLVSKTASWSSARKESLVRLFHIVCGLPESPTFLTSDFILGNGLISVPIISSFRVCFRLAHFELLLPSHGFLFAVSERFLPYYLPHGFDRFYQNCGTHHL